MSSPPRESPIERHRRVQEVSAETGHVLDHRRLRQLGVTRFQAAAQVAAGRWRRVGRQTFSTRDAPLDDLAQRWRAVWEAGEGIALVDGVSALQVAGLTGWTEDRVHISALHNHNVGPISGVAVHKVIRRVEGEVAGVGLPRTTPAVAAIRAAHWAVSDRQAATIMAMTVQQRLATGAQLLAARRRVRGRTRRAFIRGIALDIADGAQALGELEFAQACRRRGMPEPTRQVLRVLPGGRAYLDVYFEEYGLVVEIDGAGHRWGLNAVDDNLRDNAVVIDGDRVLRINVIGLRLSEEAFMDQLAGALRSEWAQANLSRRRLRSA
ncbi:hypothetical protein [Janibacter sp. GS2]|uniref:hypothetical protein n=1 Tax=Janibacter sp. GS2 TaxID=3442646 RepID=UPI003EB7C251